MRTAAYSLSGILIILTVLFISGCSSSSDPIDELSWKYRMNLGILDNGEESSEIDPLGEGAGSAQAVIESNATWAYDLYIHQFYCDVTSASETVRIGYDVNDWVGGSGGTLTLNLVLMTAGDKAALVADLGGPDNVAGYYADYGINCTAIGSYSSESDDDQITVSDSTWYTVISTATPTPTPAP